MKQASHNSHQMMFADIDACISSPVSEDGTTHSSSQAGPRTAKSGQDRARASRSRMQEVARGSATSATCGLRCDDSSPTACLQRSLESRLRARLDVRGSPEYVLTWKHWDMPSGVPICALRARGHRTSDSDCSGAQAGYPTPDAHPRSSTPKVALDRAIASRRSDSLKKTFTIQDCAQLMGDPTPRSEDSQSSGERVTRGVCDTLTSVARLTGYSTPAVQDAENCAGPSQWKRNSKALNVQAHGIGSSLSPAATERRGVLNPALPRWLMGFPPAWCESAVTAMPSSPRSRRSS